MPQGDELLILPRQVFDGFANRGSPFDVPRVLVGRRPLSWKLPLTAVPVARIRPIERDGLETALPDLVDRRVLRHAKQPGGKPVARVEAVQSAVDLDEDFLCQIMGILLVSEHPVQVVDQTALVATDELLEEPSLAFENRRNQILVRRLHRCSRHGLVT